MSDERGKKEMENGERLAKLEQKTDNIERMVTEINDNFKAFTNVYVPRPELELMFDSRDKEIDSVKEDIDKQDRDKWSLRRIWPAWFAVALSAIAIFMKYI